MNLGVWMRNTWGLWTCDTPLYDYFHTMGLFHADDMSAIILNSYSAYLNQTKFDLESEVNSYKEYWDEQQKV